MPGLNEAATCRLCITLKQQAAEWDRDLHRINEQVTFTDGRIVVAGQQRVPESFLNEKIILVPSRPEQHRIVTECMPYRNRWTGSNVYNLGPQPNLTPSSQPFSIKHSKGTVNYVVNTYILFRDLMNTYLPGWENILAKRDGVATRRL